MVALGRRLEKRHVIAQRPNQVIVLADYAVGGHRRNEGNTHGAKMERPQTLTNALMWGCGS